MTDHKKDDDKRKYRISGGMTVSSRAGNWVWFDHEALAALATDSPEAPYVVDHGMDVSSIAGQVISVGAERFDIEVPIVRGSEAGKSKKEKATRLTHVSELSPDFPAYGTATSSIQAHLSSGKMPQESIALQAAGLSYDEPTDRLILEGPYRLVHHSHVSSGAFAPSDGVGIESAEYFSTGTVPYLIASAAGRLESLSTSDSGVLVMNMASLISSFEATFSSDPSALSALARFRAAAPELRRIPPNPPGSSSSDDDEWSRPTLSDFTSKSWSDLSDAEKNAIARHFAWADGSPPSSYSEGLKLPHHRPDGTVSLRGVRNALARLSQTDGPSESEKERIRAHLESHLEAGDTEDDDEASSSESSVEPMPSAEAERFNAASDMIENEDPMSDNQLEPEGKAAAPAAEVDTELRETVADLEAKLGALVEERNAEKTAAAKREQAAFDAERDRIMSEYGIDESAFTGIETRDGLLSLEKAYRLAKHESGSPPAGPDAGSDDPDEAKFASDDVSGWAAAMAERNPKLGKVAPGVDA